MAEHTPNPATGKNAPESPAIPAGETRAEGIPLPAHGFEELDASVPELVSVPANEVISRAAVLLMNAAADKLGLVPGQEPDLDLDAARPLITALAALLAAVPDDLGPRRDALHAGLRTLQDAYRQAAVHPDPPGQGPGEQFLS